MFTYDRRSILKAAALPALGALRRLTAQTAELVETELIARQQWVTVGGRTAYLYSFN